MSPFSLYQNPLLSQNILHFQAINVSTSPSVILKLEMPPSEPLFTQNSQKLLNSLNGSSMNQRNGFQQQSSNNNGFLAPLPVVLRKASL